MKNDSPSVTTGIDVSVTVENEKRDSFLLVRLVSLDWLEAELYLAQLSSMTVPAQVQRHLVSINYLL